MKIRIHKIKKTYIIEIVKKNEIIESYQTNKIDNFQILDTIRNKIRQIELYNSIIMTYRSIYPKLNDSKILKLHSEKLKMYMDSRPYKVIKVVQNEVDGKIECCYYYIREEIIAFLKLNKLNNKKVISVLNNKIFNNKYHTLLLINNHEISLYNNMVPKFYNSVNLKALQQNLPYIKSLIFINHKVRKLYIMMLKSQYDELSSFIKKLQSEIEDRVKIVIEKI